MAAQHALTPDAAPLRFAAQVKRKPLCGASPAERSGVRVLCCAKAQRLVVNARAASCWRVGGFVRQCARGGDARQGALTLPHPQAA
jgi:hypothetical protein